MWEIFKNSFIGYAQYVGYELSHPSWTNFYYIFFLISLLVFLIEVAKPWRNRTPLRQGFWVDLFYLFFNAVIFSLVGYHALSEVVSNYMQRAGLTDYQLFDTSTWPIWVNVLVAFLVIDFISWWTHRALHRFPILWRFHRLHHSAETMGFATHFRFHFMETIIYKSVQFFPVIWLGLSLDHMLVAYAFSVLVGHLNHADLRWDYGPLKYVLNNPVMHQWHHSREYPERLKYGVNYGLTLSTWDYIFSTVWVPKGLSDMGLRRTDQEKFPLRIPEQFIEPFRRRKG